MATDSNQVMMSFFSATRALASHTGSLRERLADAYADHLLPVRAEELPPDLRSAFKELEESLNATDPDADDDPFLAAAARLTEDRARELIGCIVSIYGGLAAHGGVRRQA